MQPRDALGFFARAVQLQPALRAPLAAYLRKSADRGAEEVRMGMADGWEEGVPPPLPARCQAELLLKAEYGEGGAARAMRRLALGKVVGGDGVKEGGGALRGEEPLLAGGLRDNSRYASAAGGGGGGGGGAVASGGAAPNGDGDVRAPGSSYFTQHMTSFDLWPTRMMRVNLAKAANLTSAFNEKLSRLALDKVLTTD